MHAMILAAGFGTRLKPLTLTTPKPLLSVGNTTLIAHVLSALRAAGITQVVINVHHLKDHIINYCKDGADFGVNIQYSVEDTLLETGGGILKALPLLGNQPFLVTSADVWTDYPFAELCRKNTSGAHLVFVNNPSCHPHGDYALDHTGFVREHLPNQLTYANIGLLHPDLFRAETPGFFRLSSVFQKAIAQSRVTGEHYTGQWHNVGTPAELAALRLLCKHPY